LLIAALMWQWPDHALILREMQWFNVAAGFAAIVLVGFASATALPAWAAVVATGLTAFSPHLISFTVYMLTETPTTLLVALMLALCAVAQNCAPQWRWLGFLALGVTLGALSLVRPQFAAFAPFLAIAAPAGERLRRLGLVALGLAAILAPWLIRNALFVEPGSAPSYLGQTLLDGAYPDYMLNGDPATFPYPAGRDPAAVAAASSLTASVALIGKRIAADPFGSAYWYFLGKPQYLWQFSNIDGVGDVFIYPSVETPFRDNDLFMAMHDVMQTLQWPIVFLGALGALLAWSPRSAAPLPDRGRFVLRAAALLPVFLTLVTVPTVAPGRYAVPIYPALFIAAMVPLAIAASAFGSFKSARGSRAPAS
jgi:4-amino-4-deoxy-L-arabinose transferase-like glycosyltransferase